MNILGKVLVVFLALTGATTLLIRFLGVEFGTQNFWDHHGIFFLLCITIFPRLTLFFSSVPFGGLIWWLGFFFAPRILVAALATVAYWHSNPALVMVSWLVAISGESGEKYFVRNRVRIIRTNTPFGRSESAQSEAQRHSHAQTQRHAQNNRSEAVDVEYRRLD